MSMRNVLSLGSVVTLLALAGCSPTLQDGRFSCAGGEACPTGFVCRASDNLCYRPSDGSTTIDAGMDATSARETGPEASMPDANLDAGGDAGGGCGPNCIQLVVLNADPGTVGTVEFIDTLGATQHIAIPTYGTTSPTIDVPNVTVPGTWHINVGPTPTLFNDVAIPGEGRYLLVLGPASAGANVLLLPQPRTPLHTEGYVYIQLIDMLRDETLGLIATGAGRNDADRMDPNPFDRDTLSDPLPFLPTALGGALRIAVDPTTPQLVAALRAEQMPSSEGTYYVVVSGRMSQHLAEDDGLRFIPGIPSSMALPSSRLVRFLNTVGTNATVCDADSIPLVTLANGNLSAPFVPATSGAWALTVHVGSDCSTGFTHDVAVGTAVGRTLVSITGDLASLSTWGITSIAEPRPAGGGNSTIVIQNGLPTQADIAGATMIPSLGTASVTALSLPTTITATSAAAVTQTFDWSPMEQQSWVVVTLIGATYKAFEVDSPYRMPWSVVPATGR